MSNLKHQLTFAALITFLLASSLLLVNSQHDSRELFIKLEAAKASAVKLSTEANLLQLKLSEISKLSKIEYVAVTQIGMLPISKQTIEYIYEVKNNK